MGGWVSDPPPPGYAKILGGWVPELSPPPPVVKQNPGCWAHPLVRAWAGLSPALAQTQLSVNTISGHQHRFVCAHIVPPQGVWLVKGCTSLRWVSRPTHPSQSPHSPGPMIASNRHVADRPRRCTASEAPNCSGAKKHFRARKATQIGNTSGSTTLAGGGGAFVKMRENQTATASRGCGLCASYQWTVMGTTSVPSPCMATCTHGQPHMCQQVAGPSSESPKYRPQPQIAERD